MEENDDEGQCESEQYDPQARALEKRRSRLQDELDLASGKKTREQLRRENSLFSGAVSVMILSGSRLF